MLVVTPADIHDLLYQPSAPSPQEIVSLHQVNGKAAGMAVAQQGQRLAADAKTGCSLRYRQLQRFDGQLTDDPTG